MFGHYIKDAMGDLLKFFICAAAAVVFLYSRDYLRQRHLFKGEYYVLGLFGVLGMMIMVSAHSLLSVYLGLELLSLFQKGIDDPNRARHGLSLIHI